MIRSITPPPNRPAPPVTTIVSIIEFVMGLIAKTVLMESIATYSTGFNFVPVGPVAPVAPVGPVTPVALLCHITQDIAPLDKQGGIFCFV